MSPNQGWHCDVQANPEGHLDRLADELQQISDSLHDADELHE